MKHNDLCKISCEERTMNFKPCYQYTMKTFERLAKRIEKDCGIKLEQFSRTYAGYWQRSNGAWVWDAYVDGCENIGSGESATELLKSKKPLILLPRSIRGHAREIISAD